MRFDPLHFREIHEQFNPLVVGDRPAGGSRAGEWHLLSVDAGLGCRGGRFGSALWGQLDDTTGHGRLCRGPGGGAVATNPFATRPGQTQRAAPGHWRDLACGRIQAIQGKRLVLEKI